jgi:hydroxymethylglutaryl-CoA lyase
MPTHVRITDVSPRDGLQNEAVFVPTAAKVAFVDALSRSGLREIEVSAFVSPKWLPQLSDAEAVFAAIQRTPGVIYSAVVPNTRGLERAAARLRGAADDLLRVVLQVLDHPDQRVRHHSIAHHR